MRSNMILDGIATIIVVLTTIYGSAGTNVYSDKVRDDKTVAALHHVSESLECFGGILQDTMKVSKKNNDVVQNLTEVTTGNLDEHKSIMINMKKDLQQAISNAVSDLTEEIRNSENECSNHRPEVDQLTVEIEKLKKEVANKDQQVKQLTGINTGLATQLENENKQVRQLSTDLDNKKQENQQLELKIQELNGKVRDSEQRVQEAANNLEKLSDKVESQNKILEAAGECVREQKIAELVQQANSSQNWTALHSDLQQLLDMGSVAYRQLQNISFNKYPLFNVGMEGYTELASVLLSGGISIEMESSIQGDTVLSLAAYNGHLQLVKFLLMHGADVNVKRHKDGMTPIIWAAERGHLEVLKWLVRAGADIPIKKTDGTSALDLARKNAHTVMVEYLEKLQKLSR